MSEINSAPKAPETEKKYTREQVVKALTKTREIVQTSPTDALSPQDQQHRHSFLTAIDRTKDAKDFTFPNTFQNPDKTETFTQEEGIPINWAQEQVQKRLNSLPDDAPERKDLEETVEILAANSKSFMEYADRLDPDQFKNRVRQEAYFISKDLRATGSDEENYIAAEQELKNRQELVLPPAELQPATETQKADAQTVPEAAPLIEPAQSVPATEPVPSADDQVDKAAATNDADPTKIQPLPQDDNLPSDPGVLPAPSNAGPIASSFVGPADDEPTVIPVPSPNEPPPPPASPEPAPTVPLGEPVPDPTLPVEPPPIAPEPAADPVLPPAAPNGPALPPPMPGDMLPAKDGEPQIYTAVITRDDDLFKRRAIELAEKQYEADLEDPEIKGRTFKRGFKWIGRAYLRTTQEMQRQQYIKAARQLLEQANNPYATIDLKKQTVVDKDTNRAKFEQQRKELIETGHTYADNDIFIHGQDVTELSEDPVGKKLNKLFVDTLILPAAQVKPPLTKEQFQTKLQAFVKEQLDGKNGADIADLAKEYFGKLDVAYDQDAKDLVNDMYDMTTKIRADHAGHEDGLSNLQDRIKIRFAKLSTSTETTQAQFNLADKYIAWATSRKLTAGLANPTLVGAAFSLIPAFATGAARRGLAGHVATPLVGATLGAGVAIARRDFEAKHERAQTMERRAAGETIDPTDSKRLEIDKFTYETASIKDLREGGGTRRVIDNDRRGIGELTSLPLKAVDGVSAAEAEKNQQALLSRMGEIRARLELSRSEKIDLIDFTERGKIIGGRLELIKALAEAKLKLKDAGFDDARITKELLNARNNWVDNVLQVDISEKNKAFNKFRFKEAGKTGGVAFISGLTFGFLGQEANAAIQRGVLHKDVGATALEQMAGGIKNFFSPDTTPPVPAAAAATLAGPPNANLLRQPSLSPDTFKQLFAAGGSINLPDGYHAAINPIDHSVLFVQNGVPLPNQPHLELMSTGKLWLKGEPPTDIKAKLQQLGFVFETKDPLMTQGPDISLVKPGETFQTEIQGHTTTIPKGTHWQGRGEGQWQLIVDRDPSKVLLTSHFDADGSMVFDTYDSSTVKVDNLRAIATNTGTHTEYLDKDLIGTQEVPGELIRRTTTVDHREWYSYDKPGSQGNELQMHTTKQGNSVILDIRHMTLGYQKGLDPNPIDVQQVIKNGQAGFAFSLPSHPQQVIWVPDGADGKADGLLKLNPEDYTNKIQMPDGSQLWMGDFAKLVLNQQALQQLPDGDIATELNNHRDVFRLGVGDKNGFIEAGRMVDQNGKNALQAFATIQGSQPLPSTLNVPIQVQNSPVSRYSQTVSLLKDITTPTTTSTPQYQITPPTIIPDSIPETVGKGLTEQLTSPDAPPIIPFPIAPRNPLKPTIPAKPPVVTVDNPPPEPGNEPPGEPPRDPGNPVPTPPRMGPPGSSFFGDDDSEPRSNLGSPNSSFFGNDTEPRSNLGPGRSSFFGDGVDVRTEVYEPLENAIVTAVKSVTDQEPHLWWRTAYRRLREMQKAADRGEYHPAVKDYLTTHLESALKVMRGEIRPNGEKGSPTTLSSEDRLKLINERTRTVVHEIADILYLDKRDHEPIVKKEMTIDEIVTKINELESGFQCRITHEQREGVDLQIFEIYSADKKEWFKFPLPPSDTMVHKGGFPRVVLKILSKAPKDTIEAELPPNDLDVIAWGDESQAYKDAAIIGVDSAGVEMEKKFDADYLLKTRDIDLNSCFIGKNGLIFSDKAEEAARTGKIAPLPSYRGIYGTNMFYKNGEILFKGRDMMRAIKFVAEGKALSFDFKDMNKQIDMGIFVLVLTEKFRNKPNAGELLDKLYFLMQQIGQVREGEKNIWDVVNRAHANYSFFDLEARIQDDADLARWMMEKVGNQALQTFRSQVSVPSTLQLVRTPGDNIPHEISLNGYQPVSDTSPEATAQKIEEFVKESRARTDAYNQKQEVASAGLYFQPPTENLNTIATLDALVDDAVETIKKTGTYHKGLSSSEAADLLRALLNTGFMQQHAQGSVSSLNIDIKNSQASMKVGIRTTTGTSYISIPLANDPNTKKLVVDGKPSSLTTDNDNLVWFVTNMLQNPQSLLANESPSSVPLKDLNLWLDDNKLNIELKGNKAAGPAAPEPNDKTEATAAVAQEYNPPKTQEELSLEVNKVKEEIKILAEKGIVVDHGGFPTANKFYWQQIASGPEYTKSSGELFRGYLMVEPEDIPQAVRLLLKVTEQRHSQGKTTHFKWLQATLPSPTATPGEAWGYILDHPDALGKYPGLEPQHPRIAIYADGQADVKEVLYALADLPEWQALEDRRVQKMGGLPQNAPRRPGTNALPIMNSDGTIKKELRSINFNSEKGYSESEAADPEWRDKKIGERTIRIPSDIDEGVFVSRILPKSTEAAPIIDPLREQLDPLLAKLQAKYPEGVVGAGRLGKEILLDDAELGLLDRISTEAGKKLKEEPQLQNLFSLINAQKGNTAFEVALAMNGVIKEVPTLHSTQLVNQQPHPIIQVPSDVFRLWKTYQASSFVHRMEQHYNKPQGLGEGNTAYGVLGPSLADELTKLAQYLQSKV